jgi:hypothetical protein
MTLYLLPMAIPVMESCQAFFEEFIGHAFILKENIRRDGIRSCPPEKKTGHVVQSAVGVGCENNHPATPENKMTFVALGATGGGPMYPLP